MAYTSKNPRHSSVLTAPSGNTKDASAIIQADSTTQGIASPRMTETQRNAISTPLAGLQIFNTTTNEFNYYNGTNWVATSTAALETLVSELYVGTVGRSDYPDLAGGTTKILAQADFDRTTESFYGMDDTTTTITDDSGNSFNFTAASTLTRVTGHDGTANSALDFTAGKDVSHTSTDNFKAAHAITLGGWFAPDAWSHPGFGMLWFQGTNDTTNHGYDAYLSTSGVLNVRISTTGGAAVETVLYDLSAFANNEFHHIAVVITNNSNGSVLVYVDSELVGQLSFTGTINTGANDFDLGHRDGATDFEGYMDEFFFAPYAMDIHQIRRLYHSSTLSSHHGGAGHTLTATSFDRTISGNEISFWNLEADANDDSVNTNNLTDSTGSSLTYGETNFDGTTGAGSFDGTTDVVYDNTTDFDDEGSFTAGVWFKTDLESGSSIYMINKYESATTSGRSFTTYYGPSGKTVNFNVFYDGSGNAETVTSPLIEPHRFYYAVFRYRQAERAIDIFLDGELVATEIFATLAVRNNGTASKFSIGGYNAQTATPFGFWNGTLSNAFYAKYALTDDEIFKLYSKKFSHTQGSSVYDLNMPMKVTKETGLIQKGNGENFERATDTTDVYADLSGLDSSDKVQIRLK